MKAHLHLIKYFLDKGFSFTVTCDGITDLSYSNKYEKIKNCIEAVEECIVTIWNGHEKIGSALVIPFLDSDETIADLSDNEDMVDWSLAYDEENCQ